MLREGRADLREKKKKKGGSVLYQRNDPKTPLDTKMISYYEVRGERDRGLVIPVRIHIWVVSTTEEYVGEEIGRKTW